MIVITKHKSKAFVQQFVIQENPTSGTWGDYVLLVDELRRLDDDWINEMPLSRWERLKFNTEFLESRLDKYKELHCEYCGQPNLKIYAWNEKQRKGDMATADHFYPTAIYPNLLYSISNLLCACHRCNSALKKDKEWPKSSIKFPYPETVKNFSLKNQE